MKHSLESLPRRIFLDSCTAQTLRDYGGYINADEPIDAGDRIHRVTDGIANIDPHTPDDAIICSVDAAIQLT
jgi:hypothetical protein